MLGIDDPSALLQIITNTMMDNSRSSELSMETSGEYMPESMDISFDEESVFNSTFEENSTHKYFVDNSPTNFSPKSDGDDSDNGDTSKSTLDGTVNSSNTEPTTEIADSASMDDSK